MQRGRDFLRQAVDDAIHQHRTLVENLEDHLGQADDVRYRELCERHLPVARKHQSALEEYRGTLGEGTTTTGVKETLGAVLGKARNMVDAMRESDFLRVVGDIVTIRQSQDTFATFAAVGDRIGEPRLAEVGRNAERDHDRMQADFNNLVRELFVERVQEGETRAREAAD